MEELSLHILDIAHNAIEAGAKHVKVRIRESRREDALWIEVEDDGAGMDEATLRKATDPFFTTRSTRRVGLGLALLEQAARAAGGGLRVESSPGAGTKVTARLRLGHIDRQPLGDVGVTLLSLIVGHPEVEFEYRHETDEGVGVFRSGELESRLAGAPPGSAERIAAVRRRLEEMEELRTR